MRSRIGLVLYTSTALLASTEALGGPSLCETAHLYPRSRIQLNGFDAKSADSIAVSTGQSFVVSVKDLCSQVGPITRLIGTRFEGKTSAGVRSYELRSPSSFTREEFENLIDDEPCVAMVSDAGDNRAADKPRSNENLEKQVAELPAQFKQKDFLTKLRERLARLDSNDPRASEQSHFDAIKAKDAYEIFYGANGIKNEVIIAIIDGGTSLTHEDLKQNLWVNKREVPGNGIDDDGNGYKDDVHGYNFASHKSSPEAEKTDANASWQWAHGTKVAGLAAATARNGLGGSGVAGRAKIMALNAMGADSSFSQADTANAIRYAADNGARVINLSIGGSKAGADYQAALRYAVAKGAVVLAAAGNENMSISASYSAAGFGSSLAGLIAVGNFKTTDFRKSPTSNFNPAFVELGAPGTTTSSSGLLTTSPETSTSYSKFSGTSAATPIAAGAAALSIALIESRGYKAVPSEIESLMKTSAVKVDALKPYFEDGNALDMLALAHAVDKAYPAGSRRVASAQTIETAANCAIP